MNPANSISPLNDPAAINIGSKRYHRANLALFCAGFVTFVTLYDIQPLLPLFSREFGVSPAAGSLPLSISTATLAVAMLLAGTISETIGRKPLMSAALFLTSLLALLTAFTHTFQSLLAVRFAQGMILAGVPSVAMAYLGDEMDSSAISSAIGLYISGNAVGGMCGRIISAIHVRLHPLANGNRRHRLPEPAAGTALYLQPPGRRPISGNALSSSATW